MSVASSRSRSGRAAMVPSLVEPGGCGNKRRATARSGCVGDDGAMIGKDDDRAPQARLFVENALAVGGTIELGIRPAHYLRNVMRLAPGAAIALFNGGDGEFRGRLLATGKRACRVELETRLRAQRSEPDIWLLFPPVKRARIALIA